MPIYEYECNACGDRHEFIQKFSEGPKRKCPSCGKSRLKKLVSAAAFHLKGSGWYVTDFRDKGGKKMDGDAASESPTEAKTETTSESKSSDSKAETKSDKSDKAEKKATKKDSPKKSSGDKAA